MKKIKLTIKLLLIFIVLAFSSYVSYLSYFLYDVVIGNTIQGTYSTYNVGKEILINTTETTDSIVGNIKKGFLNIVDKEKAQELEEQIKEEKQIETEEELARKQEQEKTKEILSIIPYILSLITFLVITKYLLNMLVSVVTLNSEIINWLKR